MYNLTPGSILLAAFRIGVNNTWTILSAGTLWLLTLWIPYLNIGTTIGMLNLIATIGRDEKFIPTSIFNKEYRANMGEFLLLLSFSCVGIVVGLLLGVIPGIMLYFAWSQSFLLMEAHNLSPVEAIRASNHITYGNKWNMFLGMALIQVILAGAFGLLAWVFESQQVLQSLVVVIGYCWYFVLTIGAFAHIFGQLEERFYTLPGRKAHPEPSMHAFAG
jgi:hypothetical protein